MTCSVCGGTLDPDTIHVLHEPGCWVIGAEFSCNCPEVCAGCCTDPGCALRPDQAPEVMWACVFEPLTCTPILRLQHARDQRRRW